MKTPAKTPANAPDPAAIGYGRMMPIIRVSDIGRAHDFYTGVLGFDKIFENGTPTGFMLFGKDRAQFGASLDPRHRADTGCVLHWFVDDIDRLYALCAERGVKIIKSLKQKDYGQRAFVFADPDGNRIDVGQPDAPP